jgi:hypothetical protein
MRFDLDALETPGAASVSPGSPLMLEVEAIEEDPEQPRAEFDPERAVRNTHACLTICRLPQEAVRC